MYVILGLLLQSDFELSTHCSALLVPGVFRNWVCCSHVISLQQAVIYFDLAGIGMSVTQEAL